MIFPVFPTEENVQLFLKLSLWTVKNLVYSYSPDSIISMTFVSIDMQQRSTDKVLYSALNTQFALIANIYPNITIRKIFLFLVLKYGYNCH